MLFRLFVSTVSLASVSRVPHARNSIQQIRNPIVLSAADGEPQVLRFRDPVTQGTVVLVGAMHYNPKSIRTAARVVKDTAVNGNLGAVVLETCPDRWEASQSLHPRGSFLRVVFDNEMQAAAEQAQDAGRFNPLSTRPIILGDVSNEVTSQRIRDVGSAVIDDLSAPLAGGWAQFARKLFTGEFTETNQKKPGRVMEQENDEEFFTLWDVLDAKLLLYLPVSFARYFAAIGSKTPNSVRLPIFGWLSFLCFKIWTTADDEGAWEAISALESSELFAVGLFVCVIARVFGTILLDERDQSLAESIISQLDVNSRVWGENCTVVAVVGMAHCNGIKRAIISREV